MFVLSVSWPLDDNLLSGVDRVLGAALHFIPVDVSVGIAASLDELKDALIDYLLEVGIASNFQEPILPRKAWEVKLCKKQARQFQSYR